MEHNTSGLTLVTLIDDYFKEHNLPYEIVFDASERHPEVGVRLRGGITGRDRDDWLGWIYETEFKTFDWVMNKKSGVIKVISAGDPEFFPKLSAWLSEYVTLWKDEAANRIV